MSDILKGFFEIPDQIPQRGSYEALVKHEKYGPKYTAFTQARETFAKTAGEANDAVFNELQGKYNTALETIEGLATRGVKGEFIAKENVDGKAFADARAAYNQVRGDLASYLSGDTKLGTVPEALKKAFKDAEKAGKDAQGVVVSFVGKLKVHGFQHAVNDNLNILDKEVMEARGKGVMFGHVAATGIGATILGHALFKSKTADGDDRSILFRVLEGGVGAGVAAAGALSGVAR